MKIFPINRQRYVHYALIKTGLRRYFPLGWSEQFTPFFPQRTDEDCCVLASGTGRSGIGMLRSIISYFNWEDEGVFINPESWDMTVDGVVRPVHLCVQRCAVKKLRNGQVACGHLPWSEEMAKTLAREARNRRIKHVFISRDPRDFFVSMMNQYTHLRNSAKVPDPGDLETQRFMLEMFPNDDERLAYLLRDQGSHFHMQYEPWLHHLNCLPVKFEDLYADVVGAKKGTVGNSLRKLLEYLDIDETTIDPVDFHNKVWNKSTSATPEVNKVGQYKRVFKDEHYAILDTPEFRHVLQSFGYEW